MTWNKERYHNDEKYRLKKIAQTRKYMKTKRGKIAVKKSHLNSKKSGYYKKWLNKNPDYHPIYMKAKKEQAKKDGICQKCFKRKAWKNLTICKHCKVTK